MIKVTHAFVKDYFKNSKTHDSYKETVDIHNHLAFHIDGFRVKNNDNGTKEIENPYFDILISGRRPSETTEINEYRKTIYLPITQAPCSKVLNSFKKIVKSQDWSIDYSASDKPARITKGEHLEDYCEMKYPIFGSVENWLYSYAIKEIINDPNGVTFIAPRKPDDEKLKNEVSQPFTYIINSKNVLDFEDENYLVFKSTKQSTYIEKGIIYKGLLLVIATQTEIWEARQINNDRDFQLVKTVTHNIGRLPAFRNGGIYKRIIEPSTPIYVSFIDAMLAGLDAAARESSDLDAAVVRSLHPTMWHYAGRECSSCAGTGKIPKDGGSIECKKCKGDGRRKNSPFEDIVVKNPSLDEQGIKPPFAGFIEKDVEIIKVQNERVKEKIVDALSAINMEFLAETPLNQSGKAKEVDKDELNNYVYGVAYHLVENVLGGVYFFIGEYRYNGLIPNPEERAKMQPARAIPERYDLLSENIIAEQMKVTREASVDPSIIEELEIEYLSKKFSNQPSIKDKLIFIKQLNPFSSRTETEINDALLNGKITKKDAILAIYINEFVERALDEVKGFSQLDLAAKRNAIQKFIDEKEKQVTAAGAAMREIEQPEE